MWQICQKLFKEAYVARKQYNDAKGQTQESINNVVAKEWNMYLDAMETKATQDRKE